MKTQFAPEDLQTRNPDGTRFSDAWGLTCAQLGETVGKLLELQPDVRFTKQDLVGYHFVQYGMDSDITRATIVGALGNLWGDWDEALELKGILKTVLAESATGAIARRIRLGRPEDVAEMEVDEQVYEHPNTVIEPNHRGLNVTSLYPKEGVDLTYKGRIGVHLGSVVVGHLREDLEVYSDVLSVASEGDHAAHTIVAASTNLGSFPTIQSLRVL